MATAAPPDRPRDATVIAEAGSEQQRQPKASIVAAPSSIEHGREPRSRHNHCACIARPRKNRRRAMTPQVVAPIRANRDAIVRIANIRPADRNRSEESHRAPRPRIGAAEEAIHAEGRSARKYRVV